MEEKTEIQCNVVCQKERDPLTLVIAIFALLTAIVAAVFTWWQADISDKTSKRQLRAYIGPIIDSFKFTKETVNDVVKKTVSADVIIRNFGETPAKYVQSVSKIDILPFPLGKDYVIKMPDSTDQPVMIFPKAEPPTRIYPKGTFTISQWNEALSANRKSAVYLFGMSTYIDIFDNKHFTRYCYVLMRRQIRGSSKKTTQWAQCGQNRNDFD